MLQRYCAIGSGGTVLVVDDDPASREATRRVLEKLGLKVAEAAHGLEALQWLEGNPAPALVLFVTQAAGSYAGASFSLRRNDSYARGLVALVAVLSGLRLLF